MTDEQMMRARETFMALHGQAAEVSAQRAKRVAFMRGKASECFDSLVKDIRDTYMPLVNALFDATGEKELAVNLAFSSTGVMRNFKKKFSPDNDCYARLVFADDEDTGRIKADVDVVTYSGKREIMRTALFSCCYDGTEAADYAFLCDETERYVFYALYKSDVRSDVMTVLNGEMAKGLESVVMDMDELEDMLGEGSDDRQ